MVVSHTTPLHRRIIQDNDGNFRFLLLQDSMEVVNKMLKSFSIRGASLQFIINHSSIRWNCQHQIQILRTFKLQPAYCWLSKSGFSLRHIVLSVLWTGWMMIRPYRRRFSPGPWTSWSTPSWLASPQANPGGRGSPTFSLWWTDSRELQPHPSTFASLSFIFVRVMPGWCLNISTIWVTTSSLSFTTLSPSTALVLNWLVVLMSNNNVLLILAAAVQSSPSMYALISRSLTSSPFYCKRHKCFQVEEASLAYTVLCMTVENENTCLYIKQHEYSLKSDDYSNKLKSRLLTRLSRSYLLLKRVRWF